MILNKVNEKRENYVIKDHLHVRDSIKGGINKRHKFVL